MITYKTFLMYKAKTETDYTKLVDIVDFPDQGGESEMVDKTTLSNKNRVYEAGVQDTGSMTYTANYDPTTYQKIKNMRGTEYDFSLWLGGTESASGLTPTGSEGKFDVSGTIDCYLQGKGVNEEQQMSITIAPGSDIEFSVPESGEG